MRHAPRALLAGGLGLAAAFLAACGGGSGLLSSDWSKTLNAQLDSISSAVASGRCGAATTAARAFSDQVAKLPSTVNSTLQANLNQGASTIGQLAGQDCQTRSTSTSTTPTSSSSTSTSTTSSKTSTTPPTPTSTGTSTSRSTTTPTSSSSSSSSTPATTSTSSGTSSTGISGGAGIGGGTGGTGAGNSISPGNGP